MLQVEKLSKRFVLHMLGNKIIEGFSRVSFHVDSGQAMVLSAPSGMGKSSIMKCIYRTYLPTEGHIRFMSETMGEIDLADLDEHSIIQLRKTEISYVTQFLKVLPRVTALDIVAEPLVTQGMSLKDAMIRAGEFLLRLNIPEYLFAAYPVTFSGGEQQRVNIARAVIGRPRLLLLDEPTASLDPASTAVVLKVLHELKSRGTAIVAIFHDRDVAEQIADAFYLLTSKEIEPCKYNLSPNDLYSLQTPSSSPTLM